MVGAGWLAQGRGYLQQFRLELPRNIMARWLADRVSSCERPATDPIG
jgi:hypothetical protein